MEEKDEWRQAGRWRDETFLDDLAVSTRIRPDKTAVVTRRAATGETSRLSYAELARLTDRVAGAIRALGVEPGETVAIQLDNCWQLAPMALGCLRAGVRICPLLPVYRRRELAVMLELTEARVLITLAEHAGDDLAALAVDLAAELPHLDHVAVAGGQRPAGTLDFDEHFLGTPWENDHPPDGRDLGPDEPYLVLFTSGTTGEPKGVLHSQNTLYAGVLAETDVFGLDDSLVLTTTSSYTHYTGFVQGMLLPVFLGGTMVFQDTGDGPATLDLVAEHGVTFLYSAPAFLRGVLDAQFADPRDTSALRVLVSGSAPILPQFVEEARTALGVRLYSLFGMSENGPVTISRPSDPEDWAAHSDGHPTPGTRVRIEPMPDQPEGTGLLWVRGPTQCLGYHRREELYRASLDGEGWFNTGDIARDDGRGGVRITGRARDMILRHSFIVPVTEVEALIAEDPRVREVALVGLPDGRGDETVCAVVSCYDEPVDLSALRDRLLAAGMNELYWPTRLELRDDLPRTALGKVRKADLRAQLAAG